MFTRVLKIGWNIGNVNDNCKCKWSPDCMSEEEVSYENFRDNVDSPEPGFMINVIPESGKVCGYGKNLKRVY